MAGSSSSDGTSEFSINHRMKQPDPSCSICRGYGYIEREVTEKVPFTCSQCSGRGHVAVPNSRTGRTVTRLAMLPP
jgi:hypothetical protein